jgi:hypothetical protein
MKKETKHLVFETIEHKPKTEVILVSNKSDESLGLIQWYAPWRQYCYFPEMLDYPNDLVIARSCLSDILEVITELMDERKKKKI